MIETKTTELRIPTGGGADQLAIYKDDLGVESGTYSEQHPLVTKAGFEPGSPH